MNCALRISAPQLVRLQSIETYQNGLSSVHELPQEAHDVVCTLSIESRCRLVQKQKGWLGDKLDTQGHSLPLLNIESCTGH